MKEYKLPEVLKQLMKDKKLSQQKLADKLYTGQKVVYYWLKGKTTPSASFLMALSETFDVSIDYLIYGEER